MRYLTDEWLRAATDAVRTVDPLPEDVTIGFVVSADHAGDESTYALDLGPGPVRYHRDAERAGLTLHLQHSTAVAIATGALSAQRAFLDGELTVGGDMRLLLGHASQLASIDDHLRALRAATEFESS